MPAPFALHEKFTIAATGVSAPFSLGPTKVLASCTVTLTGGDLTADVFLEGTNDPELSALVAQAWPQVDTTAAALGQTLLEFKLSEFRFMRYRFRVVIVGDATAVFHVHRWKP